MLRRMKKNSKHICASFKIHSVWAFFLLIALVGYAWAVDLTVPDDPIEMQWVKRSVTFKHTTHFTLMGAAAPYSPENCTQCHHPVEGENQYKACATKGCHDILDKDNESQQSFFLAIHMQGEKKHQSCVSCHMEKADGDLAKMKQLAGCKQSKCHS